VHFKIGKMLKNDLKNYAMAPFEKEAVLINFLAWFDYVGFFTVKRDSVLGTL